MTRTGRPPRVRGPRHRRVPRGHGPDPPLRVAVLEHDPTAPAGWLGEVLARAGADFRTVRVHAGDPLPDVGNAEALVILGGPMGAYEEEEHPVLADEKRLVRAAHRASVPVLGICLGAQIVADALGGRAFLGPEPQYGFVTPELTANGQRDAILGTLRGDVLAWHQDTFDLPPGATELARSERYPEAFRLGRTIGLQFHPEATPDDLERWVAATPPQRLRGAGCDPAAVLHEAHRRREQSADSAARLFDAWLAEVRDHQQARAARDAGDD